MQAHPGNVLTQHAIDGADGGLACSVMLLGFSADRKTPDPRLKVERVPSPVAPTPGVFRPLSVCE